MIFTKCLKKLKTSKRAVKVSAFALAVIVSVIAWAPFASEAAGVEITGATYTQDTVQSSRYELVSAVTEIENGSEYRVVTVESYGSLYTSVSWPQQSSDNLIYNHFTGMFQGYLQPTSPSISGWVLKSTAIVVDNITIPGVITTHSIEPYTYSGGRGYFRCFFEENNAYANSVQFMVSFRVINTYASVNTSANAGDFSLYSPTVAATNQSVKVWGVSPASTDPYLYDADYGYLPAFNSKLLDISNKLNDIYTATRMNNTYLFSIANGVNDIYEAIVNDTEAADAMSSASNQLDYNSEQLENAQASLEADADANIEAVDTDISLLGSYSQSMSFWMRCVNALPSATGAFWEVLVFSFLIAFLVFILRLVR